MGVHFSPFNSPSINQSLVFDTLVYKPYPVINSESRTDANPALFPRNWYKPIRNNDSQETKITGHTKKLFCVRSWRFCLNCQFLRARGTKPNRDVLTPDNEQKHSSIYHGRKKKSKLIWRKLSAIQPATENIDTNKNNFPCQAYDPKISRGQNKR